jgi:hypothetical protein
VICSLLLHFSPYLPVSFIQSRFEIAPTTTPPVPMPMLTPTPTAPRRTGRAVKKTYKVRDGYDGKKYDKEGQEKPSSSSSSIRMKTKTTAMNLGGGSRSSSSSASGAAVAVARKNIGLGRTDPNIHTLPEGTFGVQKKKSPKRNPGKIQVDVDVQVDPALSVLSRTARKFLQVVGITSALDFIKTMETTDTADPLTLKWVEWNQGAFKTKQAVHTLQEWKRLVRQKLLDSTAASAILKVCQHQQQPLATVDAGLQTLGREANRFLSSQGITTAEAFLSAETTRTAKALMEWINLSESTVTPTLTLTDSDSYSLPRAKNRINDWKRKLRRAVLKLLYPPSAGTQRSTSSVAATLSKSIPTSTCTRYYSDLIKKESKVKTDMSNDASKCGQVAFQEHTTGAEAGEDRATARTRTANNASPNGSRLSLLHENEIEEPLQHPISPPDQDGAAIAAPSKVVNISHHGQHLYPPSNEATLAATTEAPTLTAQVKVSVQTEQAGQQMSDSNGKNSTNDDPKRNRPPHKSEHTLNPELLAPSPKKFKYCVFWI